MDNKKLLTFGAAILLVILFSLYYLGSYTLIFWSIFLLLFIPAYLIINSFNLDAGEKMIYSLFFSIGVVPFIIHYAGFITRSFRTAIFAVTILLVSIFIYLKYFRKNKEVQHNEEARKV